MHGAELRLKVLRHQRQHRTSPVRVVRVQQRDPPALIRHRPLAPKLVGQHSYALLLAVSRGVVQRRLSVVVALLDDGRVVRGEEPQGGVRPRLRGVVRGGGLRLLVGE